MLLLRISCLLIVLANECNCFSLPCNFKPCRVKNEVKVTAFVARSRPSCMCKMADAAGLAAEVETGGAPEPRKELAVEVRSAGGKGDGAFAMEDSAAGTWVCAYAGVQLGLKEVAEIYPQVLHTAALST